MKMNIGEKIKQGRKEKGISQEALAEEVGLSVQAVSKWECGLSCPDIILLPQLADYLGMSLDVLLREDMTEERQYPVLESGDAPVLLDLPDDDTLRIVQCIGQRIVSKDEWENRESDQKIPLFFDQNRFAGTDGKIEMTVEIWGSAEIEGNVDGDVSAGTSVDCGSVDGDVHAGASVTCGIVDGDVSAGSSVTCGSVDGDVSAGTSVDCGSVDGDVSAGESVTCGSIDGDVQAGADVTCEGTINGDVKAGAGVTYGSVDSDAKIAGDVYAGQSVTCKEINGDIQAGGNVTCEDVNGDVQAENGMQCRDITGDVRCNDGDVHCRNIHGDVACEGNIIYEK